MRLLVAFIITFNFLFASVIEEKEWSKGVAFLDFLAKNNIPASLYYNLNDEDKELVDIVYAGMKYYVLKNDNQEIEQALIPLTEDTQISIFHKIDGYHLKLIPIQYDTVRESISFEIQNSILQDLKSITGNSKLALELTAIMQDSIDFRRDMQKGDTISILYKRKIRLGKTWGTPEIEAAFVETRRKRHYLFYDEKTEGYYDEKARPIQGMFLKYPIKWYKITSKFTYRRYHPILHKYRPHFGIDYVGKYGTPVWSVANGKIIYRGWKGGYGKTIIIQHKNGYITKYAHLKGYARRTGRGSYIKQGQVIGYMGNTGLSTGPHLHFGLYKKHKPINPAKIRSIKKAGLRGKHKKEFLAKIKPLIEELHYYAEHKTSGVIKLALL
jgi:murein DD-endopeptidase MepM/ murein hydrolase activator NlpD